MALRFRIATLAKASTNSGPDNAIISVEAIFGKFLLYEQFLTSVQIRTNVNPHKYKMVHSLKFSKQKEITSNTCFIHLAVMLIKGH